MSDPFEGIDVVEDEPTTKKPKKSKKSTKAQNNIVKEMAEKVSEPKKSKETEDKDFKERATLIYAVKSYGKSKRFKSYLKSQGKSFTDSRLQKLSIEQLRMELEQLDLTIADKGSSDFIDTMIKNGLLMSENIINDRSKIKIKGMTDELFDNDRFLDTLERVKLKYNLPSVKLDPAIELMFVVMQTAMAVHQQNTFKNGLVLDDLDLDEEISPRKVISTKKNKNKD